MPNDVNGKAIVYLNTRYKQVWSYVLYPGEDVPTVLANSVYSRMSKGDIIQRGDAGERTFLRLTELVHREIIHGSRTPRICPVFLSRAIEGEELSDLQRAYPMLR